MIARVFILFLALFLCFTNLRAQHICVHVIDEPLPEKPIDFERKSLTFVSIRLQAEFLSTGKTGQVRIIASSPTNDLNALAIAAARNIKFKPLTKNGKPINASREIEYVYRLQSGSWDIINSTGICLEHVEGLSDDEYDKLRQVTRNFLKQLFKTHDIRPLISNWFIKNWVPVWSDDLFDVSKEAFELLGPLEKRRLFTSHFNMAYAISVISMSEPPSLQCSNPYLSECEEKKRESFLRIFSANIVERLEQREKMHRQLKTKSEVLTEVAELENFFGLSLPNLKEKNLEQTDDFHDEFLLFEGNRLLAFYIKGPGKDLKLRGAHNKIVISKEQLLFGVETPIFLRIDFVKQGKNFKIFNVGAGDGD